MHKYFSKYWGYCRLLQVLRPASYHNMSVLLPTESPCLPLDACKRRDPWQLMRLGNILPIGGDNPLTFRRAAFHPSHHRTPVSVQVLVLSKLWVRSINQGTKGRTSANSSKAIRQSHQTKVDFKSSREN